MPLSRSRTGSEIKCTSTELPKFDARKIGKDVAEMAHLAPAREVYEIIFEEIDSVMEALWSSRQNIPIYDTSEGDIFESIALFDRMYESFGERETYYFSALIDPEGNSESIDAPLFRGDYSGFGAGAHLPDGPDIETPWHMANLLICTLEEIGSRSESGVSPESATDARLTLEGIIRDFWSSSAKKLEDLRARVEAAETQGTSPEGEGRVYGWIPFVVAGALSLAAAGGYAYNKSKASQSYVTTPGASGTGGSMKSAKNLGVGFSVGVAVAALVILRVKR